jgi:hypothetical protein
MKNILEEIKDYNLVFDKTTQEEIELPFKFDDVKILKNSFVTNNNINTVFEKLFLNFVFLYKNCVIADFNMLSTGLFTLSCY